MVRWICLALCLYVDFGDIKNLDYYADHIEDCLFSVAPDKCLDDLETPEHIPEDTNTNTLPEFVYLLDTHQIHYINNYEYYSYFSHPSKDPIPPPTRKLG